MKTLLALRHAKSSWNDQALSDRDRPLNARGRRDAPRVGAFLRARGLTPDLIVSSDAARARLTADAVARTAHYAGEVVLERRLYLADPDDMIAVLRALSNADATRVMIVAHNPGLEGLVAELTGESHAMPTAALAQIALPIDRWRDLDASTRGTLVGLWGPKEL